MTTRRAPRTPASVTHWKRSPREQALVTEVLGEVRKHFDPESLGGAPLLGVDGNVLVGHGSSSPDVIEQMIHTASSLAGTDMVPALRAAFQSPAA